MSWPKTEKRMRNQRRYRHGTRGTRGTRGTCSTHERQKKRNSWYKNYGSRSVLKEDNGWVGEGG